MPAATALLSAENQVDYDPNFFAPNFFHQVARCAVADDGTLLLTTAEGKEIRLRRE